MVQSFRGSAAAAVTAAAMLVLCTSATRGADPPDANAPVSRAEYDAMKKDMEAMRQEMQRLREQKASGGVDPKEVAALRAEIADLKKSHEQSEREAEAWTAEIEKTIREVKEQGRANSTGTTELLITGDAAVGFDAHRHSDSTFFAGVAPRFLWKLNDRMFFDAALDIGVGRDDNGNNTTSVDLTLANFNYILNDYVMLTAGLFVVPFASYHHNFDPPWINKLPDDPLVFSDGGIAPGSALGIRASGGYRFENGMKVNYAVYLDNGPELSGSDGTISFDNRQDQNNNKAVGGRIGFLPIPELEVGFSAEGGQASADTDPLNNHRNVFLYAVDVNYVKELKSLGGRVTARAEWVWMNGGQTTFDSGSGPVSFTNNRNGGYVMFAYRPTLSSIKVLRNFEIVERYDRMDGPDNGTGHTREQRWTTGLDYWLDSRTVVKFAYQCDDIPSSSGASAYMFQIGLGF